MALAPKPIVLTQRAAITGELAPQPYVVVGTIPAAAVPLATAGAAGTVKKAATVAAPADSAADHAAVLAILVSLKAAGIMA